jgi:hypothetical protein
MPGPRGKSARPSSPHTIHYCAANLAMFSMTSRLPIERYAIQLC